MFYTVLKCQFIWGGYFKTLYSRMIQLPMNLKGFGRKGSWPIPVLPWHLPRGTEKNKGNILESQFIWGGILRRFQCKD
jgi:hypothetical protein